VKLRQKTREALLWGAGFKVFRDLLQFAVMLVLVRLLEPGDYGKWGLLASLTGFFGLVSAKSFFTHLLQVRREADVHPQDHFTAGLAIQGALFLVVNVAAVVLRRSDTYGAIAPLLHIASLGLLIELPGELWARLLERRLEFRRQRVLLAIGLLMVSALSLGLAFAGGGVLALVIPPLLLSLPFGWDYLRNERFRPSWEFDRKRYLPTVRFTLARIASGSLNGVRDLAQSALMVRLAGFASLGYFGRVVGLGNMFCAGIASQLVANVYPVLTRHEAHTPGFRRASGLMLRGVAWIAVPSAVLLALYAGPVVTLVYGKKWEAVIPLLPVAMAENLVRAVASTVYMLLLAAGQNRRCVQQDVLVLVLALGALALGLPLGLGRYLALLSFAEAIGAVVMIAWLLRSGGLELRGVALALGPAVIGSGLAVVAALASGALLGKMNDGIVEVTSGVAVFVVVYVAVLRVFFARRLAELAGYAPGGERLARLLLLEPVVEGTENGAE